MGMVVLAITLAGITTGICASELVTLKNEQGQYLTIEKVQGVLKGVFTSDRENATVFTAEDAPSSTGIVGVSGRAFSYNGKYLHNNLSLLKTRPAEKNRWIAPVHPDYYNHFKSGEQMLIAEPVN